LCPKPGAWRFEPGNFAEALALAPVVDLLWAPPLLRHLIQVGHSMTALPSLFATALPDRPALLDTLSYQAVGLIVVFTVLGSIWLAMELMGAIFRRREAVRVPAVPPLLPVPPPLLAEPVAVGPVSPTGGMDEGLRVAIIAAVTLALDQPVRVVSCTPRVEAHPSEFNAQMLAYASDGRRRQLDSHRPR